MAFAAPVPITRAGVLQNLASVTGTENFAATGPLVMIIAASVTGTVTPQDPGFTPAGTSANNATQAITVTAGQTKFIDLPASLINPATGQMSVVFATGTFTGQLLIA